MRKHVSGTHAAGHDPCAVGIKRRWSGSIHLHQSLNLSRLRWLLLPEKQQERHLSWQSPDQGAGDGALHELTQLGGTTMGKGHGLCSVWWECSEQGHRPAHPLPQLGSDGGEPSAPATPGLILPSYTTSCDAAPDQRHSGQAVDICQHRAVIYEETRQSDRRRGSRSTGC